MDQKTARRNCTCGARHGSECTNDILNHLKSGTTQPLSLNSGVVWVSHLKKLSFTPTPAHPLPHPPPGRIPRPEVRLGPVGPQRRLARVIGGGGKENGVRRGTFRLREVPGLGDFLGKESCDVQLLLLLGKSCVLLFQGALWLEFQDGARADLADVFASDGAGLRRTWM